MPRGDRPSRVGVVLGAVGAVSSYLLVRTGRGRRLDTAAATLASKPLGSVADRWIGAGTDLGSVYGIAGVALALRLCGHRREAQDVAAAGGLAWVAAQSAKPLLPRERPYQADGSHRLVSEPAGTSWPSGHAAVSAAMATVVSRRMSPAGRTVVAATTVAVGVSRLYAGVHHLTDVVAGWGVGGLSAAVWLTLVRRLRDRQR